MNSRLITDTEKIVILYKKGLSMKQIAEKIKWPEHRVVYWMNKLNIERRSRSEASYRYYNPNGNPFEIKKILTPQQKMLFGLGLGIYWGEGDKASRYQVRVANTDPEMIKVFVRFLIEICQLKKEKLSYHLICFNESNIDLVAQYWANQLMISREKFGKIVQIPPQGKGTYRKKSQFGVCTVIVSNIKLKSWIMQELKSIKENI